MPGTQVTKEEFLKLYHKGALNKLDEYKKAVKTDSKLDISIFVDNCPDYIDSFTYFLKTYVVELMKENNLDLSYPIYQSTGTFVPTVNYLQLCSWSIQIEILKDFDNFINQILEEPYLRQNLDQ